jgi:glycosyltransferase involved in cell wall biosynthesis
MAPFFSICIPQFNRTPFLIAACRSLADQRFRDFEVCISDDCSTDGREAEVIEFLERSGLAFVYRKRESNGRYDANLRSALGLATGTYSVLLGNDDALAGPLVLDHLHAALQSAPETGVAFTNFEEGATGRIVRRARATRLGGSGPAVAASRFRRFSFVSGIILKTAAAQAEATAKWDGSEMYQMFLGSRLIAAGAPVLDIDVVAVRKDTRIAGESVDSYARKSQPVARGIPAQAIPLVQHARLVADAMAPYPGGRRSRVLLSVAVQVLGFLYPYWLLEYRRVHSWRFAAGVARAMRPSRSLADVGLSWPARGAALAVFSVATVAGLVLPVRLLGVLHAPARRLARKVGEWSASPSRP